MKGLGPDYGRRANTPVEALLFFRSTRVKQGALARTKAKLLAPSVMSLLERASLWRTSRFALIPSPFSPLMKVGGQLNSRDIAWSHRQDMWSGVKGLKPKDL